MPEFIVIAENESDARMVCALADRVFVECGPGWLDESILPHCREWKALEPAFLCTRWSSVSALYQSRRLPRYRGHVEGEPQGVDTAAARKVILLALKEIEENNREIIGLVLSRDLDSQVERRQGLQQAASEIKDDLAIVIAAQYPKREAWVLNGFICTDNQEENALGLIRGELSFDPCEEAERLKYSSRTSRPERNPKTILDRLTNDLYERQERCWTETPLDVLRQRGKATYLAEFLDDVEKKLLPLLTGKRSV